MVRALIAGPTVFVFMPNYILWASRVVCVTAVYGLSNKSGLKSLLVFEIFKEWHCTSLLLLSDIGPWAISAWTQWRKNRGVSRACLAFFYSHFIRNFFHPSQISLLHCGARSLWRTMATKDGDVRNRISHDDGIFWSLISFRSPLILFTRVDALFSHHIDKNLLH